MTLLLDTGAEVSLISSSVPGLEVRESQVSPVSITHQPITIKGEIDVYLPFGKFQTTWKFLVVENTSESVLGADFIDSHHTESWGISIGKLWLDKAEIPLVVENKCAAVTLDSYAPVAARCTVELQARHQVLISMRCKEIRVFSLNLLEPQGGPVVKDINLNLSAWRFLGQSSQSVPVPNHTVQESKARYGYSYRQCV